MPAPTTDLVKNLISKLDHFLELSSMVVTDAAFAKASVSLSYSTLEFNLHRSDDLFLQYKIQGEGARQTTSCYCQDQSKTEMLKKHFEPLNTEVSPHASGVLKYTDQLEKYLIMAETIAKCAYQCASGDDYRPGYLSEIIVDEKGVKLEQINHMNAKSLDHKQNYSLRDLEFYIPFNPSSEQPKLRFEEEQIGIMRIHFSDRSSENNRRCGDEIRAKVDEMKNLFS